MTYRNEKLRKLIRQLPCVNCGSHGAQAAHSNLGVHGKGKSIKASDAAEMALCTACHAELDQGGIYTHEEAEALTYKWIATTYIHLIEMGYLEP